MILLLSLLSFLFLGCSSPPVLPGDSAEFIKLRQEGEPGRHSDQEYGKEYDNVKRDQEKKDPEFDHFYDKEKDKIK